MMTVRAMFYLLAKKFLYLFKGFGLRGMHEQAV